MQNQLWRRIRGGVNRWEISLLPGGIAIALVVAGRWFGMMQGLEWMVLDRFLRSRPPEALDRRILIVGVDEQDIQKLGTYPVPDRALALVIQQLQRSKPVAIGVDIFRDNPVPLGATELNQIFQTQKNVFGIQNFPDQYGKGGVNPPPALPSDQIGFVNAALDQDGGLRRSLLYSEGQTSLSVQLAEFYLKQKGIAIQEGLRDRDSIRVGTVEVPRLVGRAGGYHRLDDEGMVSLINFRSGRQPFRVVSLMEVQAGKVPPEWVRGAVVLIGIMSPSGRDFVNAQAIDSSNPELTYGVEVQAHAVSQLISAGEDRRPLIQVWTVVGEYGWIVGWGVLGIGLGWVVRSPWKGLLGVGIGAGLIGGIGYGAILAAWWIPVVPPLLIFLINGAGLTAFYRYDQGLRSKVQERQLVIDETFNAIHNGPLQILSTLQRYSKDDKLTRLALLGQLEDLDRSIRGVYESMRGNVLDVLPSMEKFAGIEETIIE